MLMADVPTHVELRTGELFAVQLPGLGTSGYVWDDDIIGEDGVIDVQWTRGYPDGSPPQSAGVSAPEVASIRAQRAGTVEVRLYQHRRWEPPERVRAEHRISVLVRPT